MRSIHRWLVPSAILLFSYVQRLSAQHVELNLIATDTLSDVRLLTIGVDQNGTDNIDPALGEFALGPMTPNFEARLIGDDIGKPGLGLGTLRDFRGVPGFQPFAVQYELILKPRQYATTVTLQWNLPLASGIIDAQLRDITGFYYNVNMLSASFAQIRGGVQRFIITLTYNGLIPTTRYQLTTLNIPTGTGAIAKFPDQPDYAAGQVVTLTATPATGFRFVSWTGDTTVSNDPVLTVTMWRNKTIAAIYEPIPPPTCALAKTVSPSPSSGSIKVFPLKASYTCGELVQLTAEPSNCWKFLRWTGDTTATDPTIDVLLWHDRNVVAEFIPNPPTLDASAFPSYGGVVLKNPDFPTYSCNSMVALTAIANPGFKFIGWEGDTIVLNQTNIAVPMYKSRRLVARFCDINSGLCGTVVTVQTAPSGLQFTVDGIMYTNSHIFVWQIGEHHEIGVPFSMQTQMNPISQWSRYRFKNWSPAQGSAVFQYTVTSSPAQFTAVFSTQHAVVTENAPANGGLISITPPSPDGFYNDSSLVQLRALPYSGWRFRDWTGDVDDTLNPINVLVNAPKRIRANYADQIKPVTTAISFITTPPNLSIVIDGKIYSTPASFRWVAGDSHQVSIPPTFQIQFPPGGASAGTRYVFKEWDGNRPTNFMLLVTSVDQTIRATFDVQHLLRTSVDPPTAGSVLATPGSSDGYYTYPALVRLAATAAQGFRFERWIGDITGADTIPDVQVLMDKPRTITAQFISRSKDEVPVTITTDPEGLSVTIDGATMTAPVTMKWFPKDQHEISIPAANRIQYLGSNTKTRYQFDKWSDNGAATHKITVGAGLNTFTASFKTFHQLTTEAVPPDGGTIAKSPDANDGFYLEGAVVDLSANQNLGWKFQRWNSADTLDVPTKSIKTTMWKPKTLKAAFEHVGAGKLCIGTTTFTFERCASDEVLPKKQVLSIQNCGFEPITWRIGIAYLDSAQAWLAIKPDSGTLNTSEIVSISLSIEKLLSAGEHRAELTITAPNADNPTTKITIIYLVNPKPHFDFNPKQLAFTSKRADPQLPPAQAIDFFDASKCDVQWTIKSDTPWVQVGQTGGSSHTATISVSVLRNDFPIGKYKTSIRFESIQADNSPLVIPIEYEIKGSIPDPPDSLIATKVDDHSIYLIWKDMSFNEEGFYLERKDAKTGDKWTRVAKIGKNETNYYDRGLEACTRYTYRIQAYNEAGVSPYSNESSATTCRERGILTPETAFIYPNPVRSKSTFSFTLSKSADVTIRIVDASNAVLRTYKVTNVEADDCNTQITWDGTNDRGERLANGVYFYIIETSAGERAVGKMALVK